MRLPYFSALRLHSSEVFGPPETHIAGEPGSSETQ